MITFEWTYGWRFLVALALGFLVGLERESTKSEGKQLFVGGVRTFPIVSMLGFGCAWLLQLGATFMLPMGLLVLGGLTAVAYVSKVKEGRYGATSEISLILTFVAGALALLVDVWVSMALCVVTTLLLSEKAELEKYVDRLDRVGFLATVKFLLMTVIILPVLPDKEYTEFHLNPTRIWQIVVLVSSVGYVGYFLAKRFEQRAGMWISGLLGGIVSSTAVSISAGRTAKQNPARAVTALQATLLAGGMMYLRILFLVALLSSNLVALLWWKLVALAVIGFGLAALVRPHEDASVSSEPADVQNPFEIRPAVLFAVLFVVLLILTAIIKQRLGDIGTFGLALIVGVSDVNPFVLSILHASDITPAAATTAIILATMSNTIAKGVYFGSLAAPVRRKTIPRFAIWALLHVPFVFL